MRVGFLARTDAHRYAMEHPNANTSENNLGPRGEPAPERAPPSGDPGSAMGLSEPLKSMLSCFSSLLLLPFPPPFTLRGLALSLIEYFCLLIMGSVTELLLGLAWGVDCLLLSADLFHCSLLGDVDEFDDVRDLHTSPPTLAKLVLRALVKFVRDSEST